VKLHVDGTAKTFAEQTLMNGCSATDISRLRLPMCGKAMPFQLRNNNNPFAGDALPRPRKIKSAVPSESRKLSAHRAAKPHVDLSTICAFAPHQQNRRAEQRPL